MKYEITLRQLERRVDLNYSVSLSVYNILL